ncbi:uncharacterized protein LOC126329592 [Schistocerca gregaria]|uniref:uncharacterized protein LOC126329592 n=1 Tax=Schistocerca gregaria TaxID=7010 RepID=UPI00211DCF46|nr:uncharacterized protein LOC126329592 [Schistocerca gregaria]
MNAWKSNSLGFGLYRIPKVKWEDIGGLQEAKKEILDTIQLPVLHPELFSEGVQHRSGVLLYGPPGTGKTLLAKAVATECRLNFISVKGPELLSMYIGLSEKNIRDIFERASNAQPCVVFFDELDSLAPKRGIHGDSGGVTDRIVSQLLAELSGIGRTSQIFVIGATNRPDLIEPSLLVPGRFDKLIYLGGHQTVDQRLHVLRAQTKNFCLGKTVDLVDLAEKCPSNLTGADMYALCSNALYLAIGSRVREYRGLSPEDLEGLKADSSLSVRVEQQHFISALEKLAPSMTFSELKRYDAIRERFESRVRPVD